MDLKVIAAAALLDHQDVIDVLWDIRKRYWKYTPDTLSREENYNILKLFLIMGKLDLEEAKDVYYFSGIHKNIKGQEIVKRFYNKCKENWKIIDRYVSLRLGHSSPNGMETDVRAISNAFMYNSNNDTLITNNEEDQFICKLYVDLVKYNAPEECISRFFEIWDNGQEGPNLVVHVNDTILTLAHFCLDEEKIKRIIRLLNAVNSWNCKFNYALALTSALGNIIEDYPEYVNMIYDMYINQLIEIPQWFAPYKHVVDNITNQLPEFIIKKMGPFWNLIIRKLDKIDNIGWEEEEGNV